MNADNKTENAQEALARVRAARAPAVAKHLAASRVKRPTHDQPINLVELQREATARALRNWDENELAEMLPEPSATSMGEALGIAIRNNESDFGEQRVTPFIPGDYANYLRTEHWRALRQVMLCRAGGYCRRCREQSDQLEVHHRDYRHLGAERERDLIVLCHECHSIEHRKNP